MPVFPSVMAAATVSHNLSPLWNKLNEMIFFPSTADDTHSMYSSKDMLILDSIPEIKKILLAYFYDFKNNILKLENTDFEITTSWITKTAPGGFCQYHSHKNAYYSAVLYQDKTNDVNSGNLLFTDIGIKEQTILINDPSEWNMLNSRRITIEPDKNLLIFFPSNLRHRINKNTGTTDRFSLAFNLFPKGILGTGDSSINLKLS